MDNRDGLDFNRKRKEDPVSQKEGLSKSSVEKVNLFRGGLLTKEGNPGWNSLKFWLITVRTNIELLNN